VPLGHPRREGTCEPLGFCDWSRYWRFRPARPVFYGGGYLYASLFLTGEHRGYNLGKGAFGDVQALRPFYVDGDWAWHGFGAVEVAFRYSYLNLDDSDAPLAGNNTRPGGKVGQFTLGMNWYLNEHTRFMFNYSPTTLVNPNTGTSTAQVFGIRFAAFW